MRSPYPGPGRRPGFSLVELLVVISILSLLVGMLYPSLVRAKNISRTTICLTNLRAIGVGVRMYLDEHNEFMPEAISMPGLEEEESDEDPALVDVMAPYLSKDSFHCPADLGTEHLDYFATYGSSYQYNSLLGGEQLNKESLKFGPFERDLKSVEILNDFQSFHRQNGRPSKNFLFADMHVEE